VLLPILTGMKAFMFPSPLLTKQIPPLVRDTKASILLATDTFLNQYLRASQPGDFDTLVFAVCGAEKVRQETHEVFAEHYPKLPILEGYGATEAAPVVAVNKPDDNRQGTVGQMLPGMEWRLEPVEGIAGGGRLHIRGPNVMVGYLKPGAADDLEPLPDGWHDTGDICDIDEDAYVKILGRAKRFAKIGGEMVSLTAVEAIADAVWPDNRNAVVSVPDAKKGERLVLVTDRSDADVGPMAAWARENGAPELAVPKKILKVVQVPLLGTGKTDYVALQKMAERELQAA